MSLKPCITDIPLLNVGVLVAPSRSVDASAYAAVSVPQVRNGRGNGKIDGDLLHATFNHRNVEALRRMPEFTNAPGAWADVTLSDAPCDDCLRGVCKRVGSKVPVPDFGKPGHISIDGWENKTAHVHGGQKLVLGLHDNHAGLNRSYLCRDKVAHADAIDKGLISKL